MTGYSSEWIEGADHRFGQRLRTIREERGLSQQTIVNSLQLHGLSWHQTTVAKVEAGTRTVRLSEALAVADALGVTLDELIEDPDSPESRARRAVELQARHSELHGIEVVIETRRREIRKQLDAVADVEGGTDDQAASPDVDDAAGEHRSPT